MTYVDDLLFAMPEVHMQSVIRLLLKKYVMKQSGSLPSAPQSREVQIGFWDFGLLGTQLAPFCVIRRSIFCTVCVRILL